MTGGGFGKRLAGAILLAALLAGCANDSPGLGNDKINLENYTPEQIYQRGEYEANRGKYANAAKYFSEIERLYPYSDWARQGLIMTAYAQHAAKKYDESRASAQRYLDFYPTGKDAAYAQYLLALSYYDQIDEVGRDQGLTYQALQALRQVIEKYPDSEYAKSAILKFDLAFDHLAEKEMEVGRYYLKRHFYAASINRFRTVVQQFQTTAQTPEALLRLTEAYLGLGLNEQAQTAAAILGYNFRGTKWYDDAYKLLKAKGLTPKASSTGWLGEIWRQTIKGEWL